MSEIKFQRLKTIINNKIPVVILILRKIQEIIRISKSKLELEIRVKICKLTLISTLIGKMCPMWDLHKLSRRTMNLPSQISVFSLNLLQMQEL